MRRWINKFIKKILYDTKLKYKFIISFSIIITIPVLVLGIFYNTSMEQSIINYERSSQLQNINQTNKTLDMFLDSYLSASSMLFNNLELQKDIMMKPTDLVGIIQTRKDIHNIMALVQNIIRFPEIKDLEYAQGETLVQLFVKNDTLGDYSGDIMNFSQIENETWCKDLFKNQITVSWQPDVIYNGSEYVVLNRRMVDFSSGEDIGVLRIFIPIVRFQNILSKGIVQSQDMLLYTTDQFVEVASVGINGNENKIVNIILKHGSLQHEITINCKNYVTQQDDSDVNSWKIFYIASTSEISDRIRATTIAMMITIVIALSLCVYISMLISSIITKRLEVLVNKTNQTGLKSLKADLRLEGKDEIGNLDSNFNRMLERINELIDREYKSALSVNQMRLELLQEQINPHLLYNTLSMISLTAKQTNASDILDVANNLIGFYKSILSKGKIITSIREELDMIRMMVDIMKFVYKLDIELVLEVDHEVQTLYMLKMILQPIVENAIIHGLRPSNGGIIIISGHLEQNILRFVVSDSGIGMPEDVAKILSSSLGKEIQENGYGLSNVARRINLFFGNKYGLKFESYINCGTKFIITVPALKQSDMEEILNKWFMI